MGYQTQNCRDNLQMIRRRFSENLELFWSKSVSINQSQIYFSNENYSLQTAQSLFKNTLKIIAVRCMEKQST
jgi:hypothetical protein